MAKKRAKRSEWITIKEDETVAEAYERLLAEGWQVIGRREEPVFIEENGEQKWLRQNIQFHVKMNNQV